MQTQKVTALASAARTVTGAADIGALPDSYVELNVYVASTVVTGTSPSMTVTYQCSHNGTDWFDHTSGAAITSAANQVIKIPANIGKFGRISYAISGTTPSFTFSVDAEAKRRD